MKKTSLRTALRKLFARLPSSSVLMFHHVTDTPDLPRSGCLLSTERFYHEIGLLHRVAPLEEVIRHPSQGRVALTFDDGLEDVYTIAYPFLKKRAIPFTIFVVTDFLDSPGYITTPQLRELAEDPLVTVGSHGITHELFTRMDRAEKEKELAESKRILEERSCRPVDIFAFSHGAYDEETLRLMSMYRYGMSAAGGTVNIVSVHRKKALPRFNVENGTAEKVNQLLHLR